MKIVVFGTRGIPNILGGVETHCEELYPRIVSEGHDVTIIRRSCYVVPENKMKQYRGVSLVDVYAPRIKSIEAIVHSLLSVLKAKRLKPDVVHIHAIGPSLVTPFARLLGMKVVTTHHGPDYDRDKWSPIAKKVLKFGERMGAKFSNRVIVISKLIASILERNYGRNDTRLIFNGVPMSNRSERTDYIESLNLKGKRYIIALGRFVKEKNFHQLIEAYRKANLSDVKLVIAGDADHEDEYSRALKQQAMANGVVLTGFIKGEKLSQILTNAALFVLPSSHEGLPISLLEAMSYNIDVVVSDIEANRLRELNDNDFFEVGNINELTEILKRKINSFENYREYDLSNYDWDVIARQTIDVYSSLLKQ